jgi:anti-sigma factor RsiW
MHDQDHKTRLREAVTGDGAGDLPRELRDCPDCRREWESWRRLHDLLREDHSHALLASADFSPGILARIRRDSRPAARPAVLLGARPGWRIWMEGLLRAPLAYGALGGLMLGAWLGMLALDSSGAAETGDPLYAYANLLDTPDGAMSRDYFADLLEPAEDGEEGQ